MVRHILIDEFDNFVKGAKFRERAEGFLGDGIFNADGDRYVLNTLLLVHSTPSHQTCVYLITLSLGLTLQLEVCMSLQLSRLTTAHNRIARLA